MKNITQAGYVSATGLLKTRRTAPMNRIEKLRKMKELVAKKQRRESFIMEMNGQKVKSKGGISPEAAKMLAQAISGLLHS